MISKMKKIAEKKEKSNLKNYSKPQLNVIDLAAGEVLANNCKAIGVSGKMDPNQCNATTTCWNFGS